MLWQHVYHEIHSAYDVTNEIIRIQSEALSMSTSFLSSLDGVDHKNDTFPTSHEDSAIDTIHKQEEKRALLFSQSDEQDTTTETAFTKTKKEFQQLIQSVSQSLITFQQHVLPVDNITKNDQRTTAELSTLQLRLQQIVKLLDHMGDIMTNFIGIYTISSSTKNKDGKSKSKEDNTRQLSTPIQPNGEDDATHKLSKSMQLVVRFIMVPVVILSACFAACVSLVWGGESIKGMYTVLSYIFLPLFIVFLVLGVWLLIQVNVWFWDLNDFCSASLLEKTGVKSVDGSTNSFRNNFMGTASRNDLRFMDVVHYYQLVRWYLKGRHSLCVCKDCVQVRVVFG